jgi:mono/diheme cytochrome c family protein
VRRPDAFDARTAFRIAITAGGTRAHAALTPPHRLGILLWGSTLLVLGGLFVATGVPLRRRSATTSGLVMAAGGVSVGAAVIFLGTLQWSGPGARASQHTPVPPTAASIAAGQRLYAQRCVPCHGPAGHGDGPLAPGLRPPPADLVQHVPLHADADLFTTIHDGIAGTAMAPFGDQMSAEEIWHTVNYLKTFGQ